mgnify:CR=1 FL=1
MFTIVPPMVKLLLSLLIIEFPTVSITMVVYWWWVTTSDLSWLVSATITIIFSMVRSSIVAFIGLLRSIGGASITVVLRWSTRFHTVTTLAIDLRMPLFMTSRPRSSSTRSFSVIAVILSVVTLPFSISSVIPSAVVISSILSIVAATISSSLFAATMLSLRTVIPWRGSRTILIIFLFLNNKWVLWLTAITLSDFNCSVLN